MQMTLMFFFSREIFDLEYDLNIEIQKLSLWVKANKLSLNIKKTCAMIFSNIPSVRKRINMYLDWTQRDTVSHTQFLGVINR